MAASLAKHSFCSWIVITSLLVQLSSLNPGAFIIHIRFFLQKVNAWLVQHNLILGGEGWSPLCRRDSKKQVFYFQSKSAWKCICMCRMSFSTYILIFDKHKAKKKFVFPDVNTWTKIISHQGQLCYCWPKGQSLRTSSSSLPCTVVQVWDHTAHCTYLKPSCEQEHLSLEQEGPQLPFLTWLQTNLPPAF